MQAIVKEKRAPGLTVKSVPKPAPGPGEVLIAVRHAGVCGTDLHIADWDPWAQSRIKPPIVVGHEFAGEIQGLGDGVTGLRVGQLVTAEGHIVCGHCLQCRTGNSHICKNTRIIGVDRDGAFAEYIVMPTTNVLTLSGIPTEVGAIMDPMGNAFHTVLTAEIPGSTVFVVGCGPIGCFAVGIARAAGATKVIASDVNPKRLALAEKMGAHVVINAAKEDVVQTVVAETDGEGADVVCEMSGVPSALHQAFASVRLGGRVQLLGIPKGEVPINLADEIIFKGITVYGVIGRRMYQTWHQMRRFLIGGQFDPRPVLNYLDSPQGSRVKMEGRGDVVILSSNNYLGLSNVPDVVQAGKAGLDHWGAGTASVRFICGTFTIHRQLEEALAKFVGCESSLSYVSCWNANEGLCPTILSEPDIVISDQLNHASIIDSIRLAKAITKCQTTVFKHSDMADLEATLKAAGSARRKLIFTDGIFSMEGDIAKLPDLVALARKYDAILAVDDSHATGVLGKCGRGTAEHYGMLGQIDVITSTLGKALGGAAGGFTAGPLALTDYLTQRSRPQLFSNALPPTVAASALAAVQHVERHPELVSRLSQNARYFREQLLSLGFKPLPGETPIVPVILGETAKAIRMSELLLAEGVFVTGFGYPVVPQGHARVRCQLSAAHSRDDLDFALRAFKKVGSKLGLI